MIGIATRLAALRTLRNRMAGVADPQLNVLAQLIDDHAGWAHYGALGPAWGDLGPTHVDMVVFGTPGVAPYAALWKRIFNVYGGDGTPANPGLKPVLDRIRNLHLNVHERSAFDGHTFRNFTVQSGIVVRLSP